MTLKREALISKLIQEKTVDEYSTLNPSSEMTKTHVISMKGYRGSNSEYAYDKQKRAYDPTAIGKLSMSTSPDGNVGINRYLTAEPNIRNARGYRDPVDDVNTFKDVNVFDPIELLTPGAVRQDDPVRTAIAGKQSGHVVPTVLTKQFNFIFPMTSLSMPKKMEKLLMSMKKLGLLWSNISLGNIRQLI